jgi:hypothetical protein
MIIPASVADVVTLFVAKHAKCIIPLLWALPNLPWHTNVDAVTLTKGKGTIRLQAEWTGCHAAIMGQTHIPTVVCRNADRIMQPPRAHKITSAC